MIRVSLLGTRSEAIYLNPHQIEYMEGSEHQTTLVMLSGKRIQVRETVEQLIEEIISYRQRIGIFKNEE